MNESPNYSYMLIADGEQVVEQGHIYAKSDEDAILRVAKEVYPHVRGHIRREYDQKLYIAEVAHDGSHIYADYSGGHAESSGIYEVVNDGKSLRFCHDEFIDLFR